MLEQKQTKIKKTILFTSTLTKKREKELMRKLMKTEIRMLFTPVIRDKEDLKSVDQRVLFIKHCKQNV